MGRPSGATPVLPVLVTLRRTTDVNDNRHDRPKLDQNDERQEREIGKTATRIGLAPVYAFRVVYEGNGPAPMEGHCRQVGFGNRYNKH